MSAARLYTAAELAGLPGLPKHARTVRLRAAREGWPCELVGAQRSYPLEALPPAARAALTRQEAVADDRLTHVQRERLAERMRLVRATAELVGSGLSLARAAGEVAAGTTHSARSIRRWYETVRGLPEDQWPGALAPRYTSTTSRAEIPKRVWSLFVSDYLRGSRPAAAACYRRAQDVAKAEKLGELPSLKTFLRRLDEEVPRTVQVLRRDGEQALEALLPTMRRDRGEYMAGQAVNADGHVADVRVRWPDGSIARPMLVGYQDIASGKILSWRVGRTENADLIRGAFAELVERWGIPDECFTDNGRAFAAKWMTAGAERRNRWTVRPDDPIGVLPALGCAVRFTRPYSGRSKPIERAWRDLCEDIWRHPAFEGCYVGSAPHRRPHDYDDDHAVALGEFVRIVGLMIDRHNARTGRRGEGMHGRSFDEVFAESYQTRTVRKPTEAQRRLLFLAARKLKVRSGSAVLTIADNDFYARELIELQGQTVMARFDADDLHAGVYVYSLDGRFVCTAPPVARGGFRSTTAEREHHRKKAAAIRAEKQLAKALVDLEASDLADAHLGALGLTRDPAPAATALVTDLPRTPETLHGAVPAVRTTDEERRRRDADDAWVTELGRDCLGSLRRRAG